MGTFDAQDPIIQLSDSIFKLLHGHDYGTIIAALSGTLGFILDKGANTAGEPESAAYLRGELRQVVGQILTHRASKRES